MQKKESVILILISEEKYYMIGKITLDDEYLFLI